jgi:hypothetical protein
MIIKISKSGKAFQVVDDNGIVYQTSVYIAKMLLEGTVNGGWVLLSMLPEKVSADRFPKSPLYMPEGMSADDVSAEVTRASQDAYSEKRAKDNTSKDAYKDKQIEW